MVRRAEIEAAAEASISPIVAAAAEAAAPVASGPVANKKLAECVRRVANFSDVTPDLKYDSRTFNPRKFLEVLPQASPKLVALLNKIAEVDAADLAERGRLFKHCIYVDSKSAVHGAKLVAAAMYAAGYTPAYDRAMELDPARLGAGNEGGEPAAVGRGTFALLCSSAIYGTTLKVRLRKALLSVFNARPENTHGERIRFMIIDQGFREGIDLYDTKYCHLFDELETVANERQAIGRNTRYCGQKGLEFHPVLGWPLKVFRYSVELPEDVADAWDAERLFDVYVQNAGLNLGQLKFAATLDPVIAFGAVDHDLTENVHEFRVENAIAAAAEAAQEAIQQRAARGIKTLLGVLAGGARKARRRKLRAKNPKPKPPGVQKGFYDLRAYIAERFAARFTWPPAQMENLCVAPPPGAAANGGPGAPVGTPVSGAASPKAAAREAADELKALAERGPAWIGAEPAGGAARRAPRAMGDVEFAQYSPTQNFVRHYFQPSSAYKGLMLYHSVGTGKTCSGIAVASTSFEKQGYTILWVTRHTLKADIWKNMYKKSCSEDVKRRIRRGELVLPEGAVATPYERPLQYASDAWLAPISFKQFTNMLQGKNDVYAALVARNGAADPLRKTLVIIDEAHKLFDPSLPALERPNVGVLREKILESYEKSGADSVRLLLMTATLYTSDPMDFIRLINLMHERGDQLPETFDAFSAAYLAEGSAASAGLGRFSERSLKAFLDRVSPYVSYLNREKDARTFAYPVFESVVVPMSRSDAAARAAAVAAMEQGLERALAGMAEGKAAIRRVRERVRADKTRLVAEQCHAASTAAERRACQKRVTEDLAAFQARAVADIQSRLDAGAEAVKAQKAALRSAKKALKEKSSDLSQERVLVDKCGLPDAGAA